MVAEFKLKYDIKLPAKITFVLVYDLLTIGQVEHYEVVYPIPHDLEVSESLREVKEKEGIITTLESEVQRLSADIKLAQQEIGFTNKRDHEYRQIVHRIELLLGECAIIDNMGIGVENIPHVKSVLAQSLVDARLDKLQPPIQNVLGFFKQKVSSVNMRDLDLCPFAIVVLHLLY